jgi:gluconokinase
MTEGRLVLSLDLGTSSFRAALFHGNGREVRGSRQSVSVNEAEPGTLDPVAAAEAVDGLIDAICQSEQAQGAHIDAVGMSCFWHSLVGVGTEGAPTTPVYLWSDLRSAREAAELREVLDEAAIHARTGARLHPIFWAAKLRWLQRKAPDAWCRSAFWLSFGDYLLLRWLGQARSSLSMVSATGLLNQSTLSWDEEMLRAARVDRATLPSMVEAATMDAGLTARYARRWPQLRAARCLPAVGDGACSNLGVGAQGRDRWAITVGTSAAVRAVLSEPPGELPPGLWRYRLDSQRSVVGGALNNGGNVYQWLRSTLRLPPAHQLESELCQRSWGSHGLIVDPSLFGERSPDWPLDASASIARITAATSTVDIAQALLESVAERIAHVERLMEASLGRPTALIATGGAMDRSAAWRWMLEHALGRPVEHSSVQESSLRGAALLALEQL